jgi:hypothetical protein
MMKRLIAGTAALLALTGCGAVSEASYSALRDGSQRALATTFSFSADVANWLEVAPEPPAPGCALGLPGLTDTPRPGASPGPFTKEVA